MGKPKRVVDPKLTVIAEDRVQTRHEVFIHATAEVHKGAQIGAGSKIWNQSQLRDGAILGAACIIGKNVYIDARVRIGNFVKIQNNVSLFTGVVIEDGVFLGPHVCFTNDLLPRAITRDGTPKSVSDWKVTPTLIQYGASIGANATIRCGVTVGRWAMIGSGSVVTKNIPDHALAYGNPARIVGYVCACGVRLEIQHSKGNIIGICPACMSKTDLSTARESTNARQN
jgi:UDP-2-acetamido-3-amino-2,3-dideoxy-glucuronate N-acetyltransferase